MDPNATTAATGGFSGILMIVLLFVMMYFMLIRPEKKRKQKAQEMRESLKKGDVITTIGGIVGKIVAVKDETIVIDPNQPDNSIPKKVQWERKLLDLGMRNTLINLRLTKTQLPILTNSLDELENALADGSDFTILPKPADWRMEEFSFEALHELLDGDQA